MLVSKARECIATWVEKIQAPWRHRTEILISPHPVRHPLDGLGVVMPWLTALVLAWGAHWSPEQIIALEAAILGAVAARSSAAQSFAAR